MLQESTYSDELRFKELSPEEKEKRGILGRLYGPMADIVKGTRNGRKYSDVLWEKAFDSPIIKEMLSVGGIPGEMDHPEDREETCSEKIAIMMPEAPKKDKNGKLIGYFDILDTPCGRIAYALAKYGFKLGVSSRGSGDTYIDSNGEESVDPDTYQLNAFDLVLLPAVKEARLQMVESFDNKKSFKKVLQESLNNASDEDRKIMTDTLNNLDIDYKEDSSEIQEESKVDQAEDSAVNDGDSLVNDLQEALKENKELKETILELNEKLSVSYTKEVRLEESISRLKNSISKLSELSKRNIALETKLNQLVENHNDLIHESEKLRNLAESYKIKLKDSLNSKKDLNESLFTKTSKVEELEETIKTLKENFSTLEKEKSKSFDSLKEELNDLKQDSQIKNEQYSKKIAQSNTLVEKYKNIAKQAVNKYIENKALTLGINSKEIKSKLSENYSFEEIDKICEDLRSYKLNMSRLPFAFKTDDVQGITLKEDASTRKFSNPDDVVDKSLFELLQ